MTRHDPRFRATARRYLVVALAFISMQTYASEWMYTVRPGDTLWHVARKYFVNFVYVPRLQALNNIEDPHRLVPGSTLRIPAAWLKSQPVPVRVVEVVGEATASSAGKTSVLKSGDLLQAGAEVTTADGANVVFEFADGSKLILRQDSLLRFDTLSAFSDTGMVDTRARLQRGRVDARVAPLKGAASRYEIHTPAAISAVRGTDYRVSADRDQPVTRAEVLAGNVGVEGGGQSQLVPEGFGTVAEQGKPPQAPRELLNTPDLSTLPTLVERIPLNLEWIPLAGALSYRFQLAAGDDFVLLDDRQAVQAQVRDVRVGDDGEYVVSVRGIDDVALEGLDATHRFTLNARPEAPFAMQPRARAKVRDPLPQFQWSTPQGAVAYRFQLTMDDEFDAPLVDSELDGKAETQPPSPLEPGTYFWRLATRDLSGELGPYGDTQSFTYIPPPPSPDLEAPNVDDKQVTFRWPAAEEGQRFRLQLARNSTFVAPMIDETVSEAEYTLPRPGWGRYYLRVATVDTDGTQGEFGTPQEFKVPFNRWPETSLGIFITLLLLAL